MIPGFVSKKLATGAQIIGNQGSGRSHELVDASYLWTSVTEIKHPIEVDLIKHALTIAQRGTAAIEAAAPGRTEIELSAIGEYEMRRLGSEMSPFLPVVASGSNAAIWERVATERVTWKFWISAAYGCRRGGD